MQTLSRALSDKPKARLPFALVAKDANRLWITAANARARCCGVHVGMSLSDGRAIAPALITQPENPDADEQTLCKLAQWCACYTPFVAIDGTDGLFLDVTGAAHLFGGETALLNNLHHRLLAMGFQNRLGLAETPGASWAVAHFGLDKMGQHRIIAPGQTADVLASLPIDALRLEDRCLHLLKRFGLTNIGELAALPRTSLKRRFISRDVEEAVLLRLDQAFGLAREPLIPLTPAPHYSARQIFAEPILATESFHQGLHDLLVRLNERLADDEKGALALTLSAFHADGGVSRVYVRTAQASRDIAHLAHLFREKIDAIDPGFGVDVLTLSADDFDALPANQFALATTMRGACTENELSHLIDRLANRLGPQNVYRAVFQESHIPERAEKQVSALCSTSQSDADRTSSETSADDIHELRRPFRLLGQPEPIQVIAEVPEGPPLQFVWRRVTHRVARTQGPERIAPEWWRLTSGKGQHTRDYYRIEDTHGRRFWVFRNGLYRDAGDSDHSPPLPTWHMHGVFA